MPHLIVSDTLGRRSIFIDKPLVTLGRLPQNDVCIGAAGVSRLHAQIIEDAGAWRLKDCGSRFGTFINGERTSEHRLVDGDRIRLGHADGTAIVFLTSNDIPRAERTAISAATALRHMAGILEGLRALGSGRVLDDVLGLVLDAAIDVTGVERGFIMLANDEGVLEFKLARARGGVTISGDTFDTSRKIPESVFATGRRATVEDLLDERLVQEHEHTVALGIRHVICAPLTVGRPGYGDDPARPQSNRIGVLYLDSRDRGPVRSQSSQSGLDMLTTEAAIAIESARLYREALKREELERDMKVAAAIQRALLPDADRAGAFYTAAGISVSCRAIGGDFFDYVDLPDGRFGMMVGDVAGKGSPAALLAAAVLGMFSAEASYQTTAASLLTRLNLGLFRRRIEARFLTAFYGILAPDGALTCSNAGQNPPVLITAAGARRLHRGGPPLGLFEDAAFEEETIALDPGDCLTVFSDGVTDAVNGQGDEFGDDRLLAAVEANRTAAPQALVAALLAQVRAFGGRAPASDDVTLMVVRYEGCPS